MTQGVTSIQHWSAHDIATPEGRRALDYMVARTLGYRVTSFKHPSGVQRFVLVKPSGEPVASGPLYGVTENDTMEQCCPTFTGTPALALALLRGHRFELRPYLNGDWSVILYKPGQYNEALYCETVPLYLLPAACCQAFLRQVECLPDAYVMPEL